MKDKIEPELSNLLYNIKYLRLKHGLSKKEMTELMGIGLGSLNRIESGEVPRNLGTRVIVELMLHFRVSARDLMEKHLDS